MANRSTVNSILPRDIKRFLSPTESPYDKYTKEIRKLFKGAGPEGYERELRKMFIDAHGHHRAYKLQRLAKEVAAELKDDIAATVASTV